MYKNLNLICNKAVIFVDVFCITVYPVYEKKIKQLGFKPFVSI